MKTYTIRLFPNKLQIDRLHKLSFIRNSLWNTLINMEQKEYEINKRTIHNYDLDRVITDLRKKTELSLLNSKACQRISKEIYSGYQSFFNLVKKDKTARPPKIIDNVNNFHTIIFSQSGWVITPNIITINKIPFIYKSHLNISELNIREIRIKLINNKWLCDICVNEEIKYDDTITQKNKILAIDLGLKFLGTGVDTTGNVIIIKNKSKKISKYYLKQTSKIQKKLSNKIKKSKKHNKLKNVLKKCYHKRNRQIKQTLHTQSKQLLSMNYHTIVFGDLLIKRLMKNKNNKANKISRSFHNSNINLFLLFMKYKSYSYKTNIVKINEQYTTQINSLTSKLFKEKIKMGDRIVKLKENIEIDRDLNSAINIMDRYFNNHLAAMTQPLDKSDVINKFNLINKPPNMGKPILI